MVSGNWARKKGSTLAYSDTNNAFKPLPFSFERNSIATRVNKEGLIEVVGNDIPRIDYTDSTEGALLLENSATNLIQQSNKYDTYWNLNNITVASGQIGVGGNSEAWKITSSSGSGEKKLNINLSVSGNHAISIYAKKGTKDYVYLRGVTSGLNKRVYFNLAKGIIETDEAISSKMTNMGDGWYRCEAVFNQQSGFEFFFGIAESDNTSSYTDDGTGTIYVQYAQAEANSVASSYIPTNGSTVQRSAETCNGSGNSEVFNDSQGVLFANISKNKGNQYSLISLLKSSVNDTYIYIGYLNNTTTIRGQIKVGGTTVLDEEIEMTDTNITAKVSVRYKSGDYSLYVNGLEVGSSSSTAIFTDGDLNEIQFGFANNSIFDFYGKTKEIAYYDEILTDLELETLTSYRSLNEMVTELNLNAL